MEDLLSIFCVNIMINDPTRISKMSRTCIDYISVSLDLLGNGEYNEINEAKY